MALLRVKEIFGKVGQAGKPGLRLVLPILKSAFGDNPYVQTLIPYLEFLAN
jgi:hypothetical protein